MHSECLCGDADELVPPILADEYYSTSCVFRSRPIKGIDSKKTCEELVEWQKTSQRCRQMGGTNSSSYILSAKTEERVYFSGSTGGCPRANNTSEELDWLLHGLMPVTGIFSSSNELFSESEPNGCLFNSGYRRAVSDEQRLRIDT